MHQRKVNSVQEACAKYFAVHLLKFEILQATWKNKTKSWNSKKVTKSLLGGLVGYLKKKYLNLQSSFLYWYHSINPFLFNLRLVGGNAVGIFIHSVDPDSAAYHASLRGADQILEYNGIDLRQATAEQAAYELAKPAEKVTLLVQYNPESKYFRPIFWQSLVFLSVVANLATYLTPKALHLVLT